MRRGPAVQGLQYTKPGAPVHATRLRAVQRFRDVAALGEAADLVRGPIGLACWRWGGAAFAGPRRREAAPSGVRRGDCSRREELVLPRRKCRSASQQHRGRAVAAFRLGRAPSLRELERCSADLGLQDWRKRYGWIRSSPQRSQAFVCPLQPATRSAVVKTSVCRRLGFSSTNLPCEPPTEVHLTVAWRTGRATAQHSKCRLRLRV